RRMVLPDSRGRQVIYDLAGDLPAMTDKCPYRKFDFRFGKFSANRAPHALPSAFLRSHFISSPQKPTILIHTCHSTAVRTALHVLPPPKVPSVALYVVECTF